MEFWNLPRHYLSIKYLDKITPCVYKILIKHLFLYRIIVARPRIFYVCTLLKFLCVGKDVYVNKN